MRFRTTSRLLWVAIPLLSARLAAADMRFDVVTYNNNHLDTVWFVPEASDVLGPSDAITGTFDGQTVDATTALVKSTWVGNANLDGVVSADDLARMSATGITWASGDFNYDGVVNADDYALYGLGAARGAGNISNITPEPSLLLAIAFPVMTRRQRGAAHRR